MPMCMSINLSLISDLTSIVRECDAITLLCTDHPADDFASRMAHSQVGNQYCDRIEDLLTSFVLNTLINLLI